MREFVFKDGPSDKFWRIKLGDKSFDVTFGKSGSKGQTQRKTFASAAEAEKAHDALIAEKVKKGYTETGDAPASKSAASPKSAPKSPAATKSAASAKSSATPRSSAPQNTERASAASAAPAPLVQLEPGERRIDLDPLDWHWAAWRDLPPPSAPARPFDPDACIARTARVKKHGHREHFLFDKAGIEPNMSRDEARFWWACMHGADTTKPAKVVAEGVAKKKLAPLTMAQAIKGLAEGRATYAGIEMGYVLGALFEPMEVVDGLVLGDELPSTGGWRGPGPIFYGLREASFLRLSASEKKALRERIRPEITPAKFPTDPYEVPSGAFLLAPIVGGLGREIADVAAGWKDAEFSKESWSDAYRVPQHVLFGLENPDDVAHQMRRLKLTLRQPEYMRAFLAHTEYSALDVLASTVVAQANKEQAANLATLASIVHAPEMVGPMQTILAKSKAPQVAHAWLAAHGGLVAGAGSKAGKASAPSSTNPGVAANVAIEGEAELLDALSKSTLEAPDARVAAIKKKGDAAKLDAFAWELFEGWLVQGAPPKQRWKMLAVGLLGGDASALALAPLVRAWPGESQHQRAVLGLECLRAIGTDVALVQLSGIAAKVKFQALKARAEACMEEIAEGRGMSREELEDRIVPDGGFDADGKRTFSFGERTFTATLGPTGAPALRDASGEVRDDLPKPNAKDDAAAAKDATDAWKLFKKTLKETVNIQSERLERAMVTQRGWSASDFEALIVKHPLMGHLARLVLWGTFDGEKVARLFRIAEDRTLADAEDGAFELPKGAVVRLVHVLSLDEVTRAKWGQVFGDYEIVSPFAQLGRPTSLPTAAEAKKDDLGPRYAGKRYEVRSFIGRMKKSGWKHGTPEDAGYVGEHTKAFPNAGVVAVLEHNGYPIGSPEYADAQTITRVRFVAIGDAGRKKNAIKLGEIHPIVFSEVALDIANLEG